MSDDRRNTDEIRIEMRGCLSRIEDALMAHISEYRTDKARNIAQNESRDKNIDGLMKDVWGTGDTNVGIKAKTFDHARHIEELRHLPEKVHDHDRKIISHEEKISTWTKVTGTVATVLLGSLTTLIFGKWK